MIPYHIYIDIDRIESIFSQQNCRLRYISSVKLVLSLVLAGRAVYKFRQLSFLSQIGLRVYYRPIDALGRGALGRLVPMSH